MVKISVTGKSAVTENVTEKRMARLYRQTGGGREVAFTFIKGHLLRCKRWLNARQKGTFRDAKGALLLSRRPSAAERFYFMMTFDVVTWPS